MADTSRTPGADPEVSLTERDIQFDCGHCGNILVVDVDGAGMELKCPFCGGPVVVPRQSDPHLRPGAPVPPTAEAAQAGHSGHEPAEEHAPEPVAAQATAGTPAAPAETAPPEPVYDFDFSAIAPDQLQKRFEELTRHLKENRSQRIELQGYINKATIELHRHQIRMKTLVERHTKFDAEFKALSTHLGTTQTPPA